MGRVRGRYEIGAKVAVATTNRDGDVLASRSFPIGRRARCNWRHGLPEAPYGGDTLAQANEQAVRIAGAEPDYFGHDMGRRGHAYQKPEPAMVSDRRLNLSENQIPNYRLYVLVWLTL